MKNKSDLRASRQAASKQATSSQESELRQRAEALHSQRHPQESQTPIDPQRLIHELQVHQIELEMQNEELRQMQVQLETARSKYSDLFDFAPVGYLTLNKEGVILEANLTAASMLGVTRSRLISQSLKRFILPEYQDTYYLHCQALFANDTLQTCELRLFKKGAIPFWARFEANLVQNEDEIPVYHSTVSDISVHKQAEIALRESNQRYDQLAEQRRSFAWEVDAQGLFTYISHVIEKVTGYKPEEVSGKLHFYDLHPEEGREEFVKTALEIIKHKESFMNLENKIQTKDGRVLIVSTNGIPVLDANGELLGYRGADLDITERKQIEMALRESEEKYRVIFDNEIYAICIFELGTLKLLDVNDAYVRLYGYSREELLSGMTIHDITTEHQATETTINQAAHDGTIFIPLRNHRKKDGTFFPIEIVAGPFTWKGSKVLFSMAHDISDRIRAEEALREIALCLSASEQTLRQIFEVSPVAITISLPESGLILAANDVFLKLFGYAKEEVIHKTSKDLNLFEYWEERQAAVAELRQNGNVQNLRLKMQRKDGSLLVGLFSVETIQYQGQTCMVSAIVDIGELEQIHATLLEAQKMAGLGTLVAGLAHEMNSPLQVITGSVDNLLNKLKIGDPITPEHMEKYLGNASRNAWRIAEIIRALMIYAHPMKMNIEACDINRLVQDSVLLTENHFKHSNIHFQFALEEGLPELQCEASDLVQMLVALLKNAGDALPEGGQITLTSAYDVLKEEIKLSVEDDGVGIEPENLDKIFDPFFTTKPPGQGVGLGLTVMQGVMRKYGGSIKVESVPGKGSAFHLTFPLKDSASKTENPFKAEGRYAEIKPENRENT